MNSNVKLNSLLKEGRPDVQLPARFQSEVWRRISMAQDRSAGQTWLLFSSKMIFGFSIAMICFGSGLAVWQAMTNDQKQMQVAQARYLHAVDPFANVSLASNK